MAGTEIATLRRLSDIVEEYDTKIANLAAAIAEFESAGNNLKIASCVGGTWGNVTIDTGHVYDRTLQDSLLKSAWMHVYKGLQIEKIASAQDKRDFERAMQNPPPFTLDNITATFGDFVADPWGNILRGLAEVFSDLDPAFKSHEKMKIGVSGLPKRIILTGFGEYSSWGKDKLTSVLNALAAYQRKPMVTYQEINLLMKDENALLVDAEIENKSKYSSETVKVTGRGIRLKRYSNGNGHLYFEPDTLRDINKALAAYYGEVIADCHDDGEPVKRRESTAVSKDLQYYPTPNAVVKRVIDNMYSLKDAVVLEPSCGCGRFMDALRNSGAKEVHGIEVDAGRVQQCRDKGHHVTQANFLEVTPNPIYDFVVMNPPFYGTHYVKHVNHALKFLKPGGTLYSILPITARYDHGLLEGSWQDLPVGSFRESGTNINTTILTMHNKKK